MATGHKLRTYMWGELKGHGFGFFSFEKSE